MSEKKDDGNPAFPAETSVGFWKGMSLRDWFAGQALVGMGMWFPSITYAMEDAGEQDLAARAAWAYQQADAMLKERNG